MGTAIVELSYCLAEKLLGGCYCLRRTRRSLGFDGRERLPLLFEMRAVRAVFLDQNGGFVGG